METDMYYYYFCKINSKKKYRLTKKHVLFNCSATYKIKSNLLYVIYYVMFGQTMMIC